MTLSLKQKLDEDTELMMNVNGQRSGLSAETYYRTLDVNGGLALVEYQPFTSVKHQLRVHASEAMGCPVLGDHKYSATQKLLPQRLPQSILKWLKVRSPRSRDLNMHLHLREIIIPGFSRERSKPNLLVSARLPQHIYRTLQVFQLKPGCQTDFKYSTKRIPRTPKCDGNSPNMKELYKDPLAKSSDDQSKALQRQDCYVVYKPKIKV